MTVYLFVMVSECGLMLMEFKVSGVCGRDWGSGMVMTVSFVSIVSGAGSSMLPSGPPAGPTAQFDLGRL